MSTIKINNLIGAISRGEYQVPTFQRGFEWGNDKIRKFFESLYKEYPIGGILIWQTKVDVEHIRGRSEHNSASYNFIIDGQQRITALYAVMNKETPDFYIGNPNRSFNLYFNLRDEEFAFLIDL